MTDRVERRPGGARACGDIVVLPPIREPMSPEEEDRIIEILGELLRAHTEREAARRAGVSGVRARVQAGAHRRRKRPS